MKLYSYIAGINLLIAPLALAQGTGDRGGNGGDVVVCPDGSVRMLDTIEAIHAGLLPLVENGNSLREKVQLLIARQNKKDLNLGKALSDRSDIFLKDIENLEVNGNRLQANTIFGSGTLPNVPDEGATFIPEGCTLEQLIVRTPNPLPNQKQYAVREDLWKRMNLNEQATAVLHESIYGYLVDSRINSSPSARWYNTVLISNQIAKESDLELSKKMDNFQFPRQDWLRKELGFSFSPFNAQYNEQGQLSFLKNAHLDSSIAPRIIPHSETAMSAASNIEIVNGKWKKMTIENLGAIDLKTGKFHFWKGDDYTDKASDVKPLKKLEMLIDLRGAIVERTELGYRISNARKYFWRLDPTLLIPFLQLRLLGQYSMLHCWTSATYEQPKLKFNQI